MVRVPPRLLVLRGLPGRYIHPRPSGGVYATFGSAALRQRSNDEPSNGDSDDFCHGLSSGGNVAIAAPSRSGLRGVKWEKSEHEAESGASEMANSIDCVEMAIENSKKEENIAWLGAIQFKIINSMPMNDEGRGAKKMQLLSKASSLNAGEPETIELSSKADGVTKEPELKKITSFGPDVRAFCFVQITFLLKMMS